MAKVLEQCQIDSERSLCQQTQQVALIVAADSRVGRSDDQSQRPGESNKHACRLESCERLTEPDCGEYQCNDREHGSDDGGIDRRCHGQACEEQPLVEDKGEKPSEEKPDKVLSRHMLLLAHRYRHEPEKQRSACHTERCKHERREHCHGVLSQRRHNTPHECSEKSACMSAPRCLRTSHQFK